MSWLRRVLGRGPRHGEPAPKENAENSHPHAGQPAREMSQAAAAGDSSGISGPPTNGDADGREPAQGVRPGASAAHRGDVRERPSTGAGWDDDGRFRVLFVCTANICRSAFAEVLARSLAGPDAGVVFASAGTYGLPAHPMNPEVAVHLPEGVSGEGFRSRRVTAGIVADADLILPAEASHRTYLLEEYPSAFRRILTLGQFAEAASTSGLTGRALLEEVARFRPMARPEHDVADPYRRGAAANAAATAQIERLLRVIVPALGASAHSR